MRKPEGIILQAERREPEMRTAVRRAFPGTAEVLQETEHIHPAAALRAEHVIRGELLRDVRITVTAKARARDVRITVTVRIRARDVRIAATVRVRARDVRSIVTARARARDVRSAVTVRQDLPAEDPARARARDVRSAATVRARATDALSAVMAAVMSSQDLLSDRVDSAECLL